MTSLVREIGSTLTKLRALLVDAKKDLLQIQNLHNSLEESLRDVWVSPEISKLVESPQAWKEFTSLLGSGKIVSISAQTNDALATGHFPKTCDWISDGHLYSQWIGRGIAGLASEKSPGDNDPKLWKPLAELCGRAFSIGYSDDVVDSLLSSLVLSGEDYSQQMLNLLRSGARHEQRQFLMGVLNFVRKHILQPQLIETWDLHHSTEFGVALASCAALIRVVLSVSEVTMSFYLSEWLLKAPICCTELLRAVITALPEDERVRVLEKAWQTFGDKLYTKHTPIIQQEALMTILLLAATAVHRQNPMQVFVFAHSSLHTNGISNRLGSASARARTLGTFLGTVISELVDKPETRMSFEFDEQEKNELQSYRDILSADFMIGSIAALVHLHSNPPNPAGTKALAARTKNRVDAEHPQPTSKITVIEEVNDDLAEDADSDLTPMTRPDSDPEDSDPEDPSVARRTKPKAPVYIRDLLSQLQSTEDADAYAIALAAAPGLIRRKAAFGNELADQAVPLAAAFANMQDTLALDGWVDLRLRGLVALLAACPTTTGPWVAGQAFTGDLSASGRVTLLTAIGLAARQLSGRDASGEPPKDATFASRTLPERLHRLYAAEAMPEATARRLDAQPPADDALVAVSQTRTKRTPRTKPAKSAPNALAPLVASSFFFPLTAVAAAHMPHSGGALGKHVLPTLVQTLALLLIHAGPATTQLAGMANELWEFLLGLRGRAAGASGAVLEAVLFGFLTVLGAYEDKRTMAVERGRELLETQAWVEVVFERLSGSGSRPLTAADLNNVKVDDESQRVQTLAAGVLMACKDVVDAHNRLMLGDLADFR